MVKKMGWRGRRGRQGDDDEEEEDGVMRSEDEEERDWEKGKGAHGKDQH